MPIRFLARRGAFPAALAVAASLAACSSPAPPPTVALDLNQPAQSADQAIVSRIVYPPDLRAELAPLKRAMSQYASAREAELIEQVKRSPPTVSGRTVPGRLSLGFSVVTQTQAFVSALAQGEADVGGAHPETLRATFTEYLPNGTVVSLSDLFVDPQAALKIFSDEVRRRLEANFEAKLRAEAPADKNLEERIATMRETVASGSEPKAENFANFLVDGVDGKAIGITLIFPPAQVASYAEGVQQVEVPVKLFVDAIKPEYRDAFDREEDRPVAEPRPGEVR